MLKQNLELQVSQSQTSLQQLQAQFTQEQQRLTQELEELEEQHQQRYNSLKEAHVLAYQAMEEEKEKEQRVSLYVQKKFPNLLTFCLKFFSSKKVVGSFGG